MSTYNTVVVQRFQEFWRSADCGPVLIGFRLPSDHMLLYGAYHGKFADGLLHPEDIHVEEFLPDIEAALQEHRDLDDDLLFTVTPWWGVPWIEAILGATIEVGGRSIWAPCMIEDWSELDRLGACEHNPWLDKLLECARILVQHSQGRYAVAPPVLHTATTVGCALRGTQRFLLDLFDYPDEVRQFLKKCTDIVLKVNDVLIEILPPVADGASNYMGVWLPEPHTVLSDDAAAFLSPALYRAYAEEGHRRQTEAWPGALIHLHGSGLSFFDNLLTMPHMKGIQITVDPNGPSATELIPALKKIQAAGKKPILIAIEEGQLKDAELLDVIGALRPEALSVILGRSRADAARLLSRVRGMFGE